MCYNTAINNVTIDPNGLNENDFYPTNKVTTLYYIDANGAKQTADFPVPGVKVKFPAPTPTNGSLTISKELKGNLVATDFKEGFSFTVRQGTKEIENIEVWPGCPVTLTLEPGMYTIVENNAEVADYKLTTSGTGDVTVEAGKETLVTVTNTYEKEVTPPVETVSVEIPITKTVTISRGSKVPVAIPFTFKAYVGDLEVGELKLTPTKDSDWTATDMLPVSIPYDLFEDGVATVTIKEIPGGDTRWKYDTKVYTVTVRMVIERAVAEDPLVIMLGNDKVESVSFENIYSYKYTPAPKPTTPTTVTSVKTGDMGVALYAGLAILSMTGSAGVILRRRKNDK